jgi:hypothetical protein
MTRRSLAHAALLISTACAFTIASCAPRGDAGAGGPVTVAFDSTDAARLGDVSVYPLSRDALAALASARPSAEDWQRILSVRVTDSLAGDSTALPLLGTYAVSADTLYFRPRFSPAAGVTYAARFDGSALYRQIGRESPAVLGRATTTTWRLDVPAGVPSTVVRAIYPTADVVPMNLLRMYVEFSAPMTSGRSYEFVKLYGEDGALVEDPFFTAGDAVELWDADHTRLTVLFDPGRIKRDLKPHEEMGLPLRAGKRYRLVIDSTWRDAEGRPLVRSQVKEFRVGPQDRALVRTADWRVTPPRAGTNDSLVLTFPESLDRALLARLITVRDSSGALIHGGIGVSERETRWAFAPRVAWKRMRHAVHVDTELEDLAGNNLKKLFDVAPGDSGSTGVSASVVRLPFEPR